jgi:hypothetical protein
LERSLTVLLPVHNVQSTLAATVPEILEVVSELTARFELVIIDDGSSDATSEVAWELTRCYPQVRFLSHGSPLGCEAAVRRGLRQSSGEIVVVRHQSAGSEVEEIRELWRAAKQQEPVGVRHDDRDRLQSTHFSARHAGHPRGYQMIDRAAAEQTHCRSKPTRPNYLAKCQDSALPE